MKKGIKILAVLTILAATNTIVFARGRGGLGDSCPGFGGKSYIQQELNLTQEQQDKIFKISQDFRQKFYDNRKDYIKIAELRVERLKSIDAVLTKEQKEKFASILKNRNHRSKGPRR